MRNRRGVALLVALWLMVAIAAVALTLMLEARAHRVIGFATATRGTARGAAVAGLAIARARLEQVLRQLRPTGAGSNVDLLRASDPWLDVDSLFADTLRLGDVAVLIRVEDLGANLNINALNADQLRAFLNFTLRDYTTADALTQAVADWRDADDFSRLGGAERKEYLAQGRFDLPSNRDFREVEDLRAIEGMTPELFERIRPYLRTRGDNSINVNSAPEPVLYAIRGITQGVVTRILALRSQHQRIGQAALDDWLRGPDGAPMATVMTQQCEITVTAYPSSPAYPVQLRTIVQRHDQGLTSLNLTY